MALLIPFYQSEKLFSLIYDGYEENLLTELYMVHKNLKIPFNELYDMPVMYRRELVKIHNRVIEVENNRMKRMR